MWKWGPRQLAHKGSRCHSPHEQCPQVHNNPGNYNNSMPSRQQTWRLPCFISATFHLVIILILGLKDLELRRVRCLAQGHTVETWWKRIPTQIPWNLRVLPASGFQDFWHEHGKTFHITITIHTHVRVCMDTHMYRTEKFHKTILTSATFDGIRFLFHSTLVCLFF